MRSGVIVENLGTIRVEVLRGQRVFQFVLCPEPVEGRADAL
jgi:hypothetical protein